MSPRKARRRWNRATVCWYLAGVIAVQVVLGAVVDWTAPTLRDPFFHAAMTRLRERRAETPTKPLLVALGSSRILWGFDAGRVSQADSRWLAFNFGDLGEGPMLQQVYLRRLLAAGVRPDRVLIEILPVQMTTTAVIPTEETALGDNAGRLTWAEMRSVSRYFRFPGVPDYRWLRGQSLLSFPRQRDLHEAIGADIPIAGTTDDGRDGFGFAAVASLTPTAAATAVQVGMDRYGPKLGAARLADGPRRAFGDLIDLCRREQLAFAVVRMPESEGLRRLYPAKFRADLDAMLAAARQGGDFPMIDAQAWVGDDGFWDPHHLHRGGAASFSDRLEREWLAGQTVPAR